MPINLKPGDRVRLTRPFGEYPVIPVPALETGTVASIDADSIWIALDRHHRQFDAWENQLQVTVIDYDGYGGQRLPNLDDEAERVIEPIPASWTVKEIMTAHGYERYNTGGGCWTWAKDKWTRWICTTDNGVDGNPDAAEWFVGTHDEDCGFAECNVPVTLWRALRIADFLPMPILGDQVRFFDELPEHQQIAAIFAVYLRQDLKPAEIAEVIRRNKEETNAGICHSHDFCDANITMDSAHIAITGKSAQLSNETPDASGDHFNQTAGDAWGKAWDLAKECEFDAGRIMNFKEGA